MTKKQSIVFTVAIIWIKPEFGGRTTLPQAGMRPTIRFQRHINAHVRGSWDVRIRRNHVDEQTWSGEVELELIKHESPYHSYVAIGELIELLEGYRVIGVGKILSVS